MGTKERKDREKFQRRRDIIAAAKEIFIARGYQATTMDEIAEKAEYSKGTIYLYFQSKDELYLSLLEEGTKILADKIYSGIEDMTTSGEKLYKISDAYYEFYIEYPLYYQILFFLHHEEFEANSVSPELHEKCFNSSVHLLKELEQIIMEGVQSGEFKEIDTWKTTFLVWSSALGIFFREAFDWFLFFLVMDFPSFCSC